MADSSILYTLGFALIIIGCFVFTFAAILIAACNKIKAKAGGVIIIGPVPIIFGSNQKTIKNLLLLSITLTILLIITFFVYYFLLR